MLSWLSNKWCYPNYVSLDDLQKQINNNIFNGDVLIDSLIVSVKNESLYNDQNKNRLIINIITSFFMNKWKPTDEHILKLINNHEPSSLMLDFFIDIFISFNNVFTNDILEKLMDIVFIDDTYFINKNITKNMFIKGLKQNRYLQIDVNLFDEEIYDHILSSNSYLSLESNRMLNNHIKNSNIYPSIKGFDKLFQIKDILIINDFLEYFFNVQPTLINCFTPELKNILEKHGLRLHNRVVIRLN